MDFPSIENGPAKRSWQPAVPCCGCGPGHGYADKAPRAFKFSVQTEDGVTHRFLMTRDGVAWLACTMVEALSPWLAKPLYWWYLRQQRRSSQSAMSSEIPNLDGSPVAGHSK